MSIGESSKAFPIIIVTVPRWYGGCGSKGESRLLLLSLSRHGGRKKSGFKSGSGVMLNISHVKNAGLLLVSKEARQCEMDQLFLMSRGTAWRGARARDASGSIAVSLKAQSLLLSFLCTFCASKLDL